MATLRRLLICPSFTTLTTKTFLSKRTFYTLSHHHLHQQSVKAATITLRRNYAAEAVSDEVNIDGIGGVEGSEGCYHPWPEWVGFIEKLQSNGYFEEGFSIGKGIMGKDYSLVKSACMNFARERFDLLKSLSKSDIKTVAEHGCPNLQRKSVTSAKRLRVFVKLDESDVCSTCHLRASCDRAYQMLNTNEEDARTVDIVRMLMMYAQDPLVFSEKEKPNGRENIEESVRKLLCNLVELSDTIPKPALPMPAVKASNSKEEPEIFEDREHSRRIERTPRRNGNPEMFEDRKYFLRDEKTPRQRERDIFNDRSYSGGFERTPRRDEVGGIFEDRKYSRGFERAPRRDMFEDHDRSPKFEMKQGDWECSECNFINFARNKSCLKCDNEGPGIFASDRRGAPIEMKKGDWNCPECNFMNFSRNTQCMRCSEGRPKRDLQPGEWECPSCDFVNFRANMICKKCNCERPNHAGLQYEDAVWTRPRR